MNRLFAFVITALLAISISARDYHIIPQPKDIQDREGQFTLTQGMKIFAQGEANCKVATFFVNKLNRSTGLGLTLTAKKGQAQIQLLSNSKIKGDEAYRLTVSPKQVVAEASTDRGLFYAMQTFMQMLPPEVEINAQHSRVIVLCSMLLGPPPALSSTTSRALSTVASCSSHAAISSPSTKSRSR